MVRWKQWGFGAEIEYLPPGLVKFGDATTLSWLQADAQARYFVWKPIFVGALAGYQFSRADSTKFGSKVNYISSAMVVGLRAGVLFTLKNGVALGADLGVTVPLFTSLELDSDGTEDSNARKAARTFGEFAMPYLNLFRIGYFY
jgi:hypothetical protein